MLTAQSRLTNEYGQVSIVIGFYPFHPIVLSVQYKVRQTLMLFQDGAFVHFLFASEMTSNLMKSETVHSDIASQAFSRQELISLGRKLRAVDECRSHLGNSSNEDSSADRPAACSVRALLLETSRAVR